MGKNLTEVCVILVLFELSFKKVAFCVRQRYIKCIIFYNNFALILHAVFLFICLSNFLSVCLYLSISIYLFIYRGFVPGCSVHRWWDYPKLFWFAVSRLKCESESFKMDLIIDINTQIYPIQLGMQLSLIWLTVAVEYTIAYSIRSTAWSDSMDMVLPVQSWRLEIVLLVELPSFPLWLTFHLLGQSLFTSLYMHIVI